MDRPIVTLTETRAGCNYFLAQEKSYLIVSKAVDLCFGLYDGYLFNTSLQVI